MVVWDPKFDPEPQKFWVWETLIALYIICSIFNHSIFIGVQQGSRNREARNSQKKKKAVIRMLGKLYKVLASQRLNLFSFIPQIAAVVITFFVCWFPFHVQRLWFLYAKRNIYYYPVNEWLFSIAGFSYYVTW